MYAVAPPKLEIPVTVLAAEPPAATVAPSNTGGEVIGALLVDQRHRAFLDILALKQRIWRGLQNVDDGVANGDDVVCCESWSGR